MTKYPELFASLARPFDRRDIKVRKQAGRELAYITARTTMNRLDEVLGPENWWDHFEVRDHSVECQLTIRLPDGTTITKVDAGGYAGMSDQGDDDKSGYSDAFKRAAVKFGVGRHLYGDGVADLAETAESAESEPEAQGPPWKSASDKPTDERDYPTYLASAVKWLEGEVYGQAKEVGEQVPDGLEPSVEVVEELVHKRLCELGLRKKDEYRRAEGAARTKVLVETYGRYREQVRRTVLAVVRKWRDDACKAIHDQAVDAVEA